MFSPLRSAAAMAETQPAALPWLHPLALDAMKSATARVLASGQIMDTAAEAVREVALARYPALPLPMVADAVAAALALDQLGGGALNRGEGRSNPAWLRYGWSPTSAILFGPVALQTLGPPRLTQKTRQPPARVLLGRNTPAP